MMNEKLTLEKLKKMEGGLIFSRGLINGRELTGDSNKIFKWVACRGKSYFDWCIYYHLEAHEDNYIQRFGDKIFTEEIIKDLVPCNKKAWEMYRF